MKVTEFISQPVLLKVKVFIEYKLLIWFKNNGFLCRSVWLLFTYSFIITMHQRRLIEVNNYPVNAALLLAHCRQVEHPAPHSAAHRVWHPLEHSLPQLIPCTSRVPVGCHFKPLLDPLHLQMYLGIVFLLIDWFVTENTQIFFQ